MAKRYERNPRPYLHGRRVIRAKRQAARVEDGDDGADVRLGERIAQPAQEGEDQPRGDDA